MNKTISIYELDAGLGRVIVDLDLLYSQLEKKRLKLNTSISNETDYTIEVTGYEPKHKHIWFNFQVDDQIFDNQTECKNYCNKYALKHIKQFENNHPYKVKSSSSITRHSGKYFYTFMVGIYK